MNKVQIFCLECETFVSPTDIMLTVEDEHFPLTGGYMKLSIPSYEICCPLCDNELVLHELNRVNIMIINAFSTYAKELVKKDSSFIHLWSF